MKVLWCTTGLQYPTSAALPSIGYLTLQPVAAPYCGFRQKQAPQPHPEAAGLARLNLC